MTSADECAVGELTANPLTLTTPTATTAPLTTQFWSSRRRSMWTHSYQAMDTSKLNPKNQDISKTNDDSQSIAAPMDWAIDQFTQISKPGKRGETGGSWPLLLILVLSLISCAGGATYIPSLVHLVHVRKFLKINHEPILQYFYAILLKLWAVIRMIMSVILCECKTFPWAFKCFFFISSQFLTHLYWNSGSNNFVAKLFLWHRISAFPLLHLKI